MEKEITTIKKSIGGLKGSLAQTNQKVKALEDGLTETIDGTSKALCSVKNALADLEEKIGKLSAQVECLSYKANRPWYKRLLSK